MTKLPDQGLNEAELWLRLADFCGRDFDWSKGGMFGHAFIAGDDTRRIAERAYAMHLWGNALDPTLFPSTVELESEVMAIAAAHLSGGDEAAGSFTSGGTESIMLAVKTARDRARANRPGITAPELVLPVSAHAAFFKAAHYLGLKPVITAVDPHTFQADVQAIRDAISDNTVMIAASAPSYAQGVMDPITEIGSLAAERGVFFHVDACMGGFILPYFRRLGAAVPDFDFSVPGVCSISMDFHKYAFAPKGASVVVYRNAELRRHQIFACAEWTGYPLVNPTAQSSRSGGALAATWAVLHYLGDSGYLGVAKNLKDTADKAIAGVASIPGLSVMGRPVMSLIAVSSDTVPIFRLADELRQRGWYHQPQLRRGPAPPSIHLTIVPPNTGRIDAWLADLAECAAIAKKQSESPLAQEVIKRLAGRTSVSDDELALLLQAGGIGGGKVPERMAEINEVLNALPPQIANRLLIAFFNQLGK